MSDPILKVSALGAPPWRTVDPFLFCVHHLDHYPEGDARMAPKASLAGRQIGMDFEGKDGWRMYHGDVVPGFPRHPHRGFETITLARQGYIDHSDSLGATARFGHGDVQWMTAGKGVVHSEMFPLVKEDAPNPGELFQIWMNLPPDAKMAPPHFAMLWSEHIPKVTSDGTELTVVAGARDGLEPPPPPPHSWASRDEADVAIWTLRMEEGGTHVLPPAREGSRRVLYFFEGTRLRIGDREVERGMIEVQADVELPLRAPGGGEVLMLQGRPIGAPVAHYGPFVMNTRAELQQAFVDYQKTQFGGWPWKSDGPVHPREEGRFAIHADGREDRP